MVKVPGTVPKGRLIQGLCKPIHGNMAIYFYPGVPSKTTPPTNEVVALLPVILLPLMGVGGHRYGLEHQYFNKVPR